MTKKYIDADEAIKALCHKSFPGFSEAGKIIKEVPAADVQEVQHGRWIEEPGLIPRCSICGEYSQDADTGAWYCPNCGAKMDEVEECQQETK